MKFISAISICFAWIFFHHNASVSTTNTVSCAPPSHVITTPNHPDMAWIKPGHFTMGSIAFTDSKPLHTVTLTGFWMDIHEVTNAEFARFVAATQYITVAERPLKASDYPGVPPDKLVPGSAVFSPPPAPVSLDDPLQWWKYVPGACWKHPTGPKDSIKPNEPVVQVCYEDAKAYAHWAGKALPTEAQWEYAARAGNNRESFYWGEELKPADKWMANIFQGSFPDNNTKDDGYTALAPIKCFPANAFGLYDMEGNVWEWCADFYQPNYTNAVQSNPKGPASSFDPDEPNAVKHVQRGGSFICSDQYCNRYRAGSRGKGETTSASNNLGFRCVSNL